jgi:hypothetical protein
LLDIYKKSRLLCNMDECGTESQSHGFFWENHIKTKIFGITEKSSYTCIHDISKEQNRFDESENISIKTMGGDTLFLGSALRIFEYSPDEKHTCMVIVYRQREDKKTVSRVVEFSLDRKDVLFGTVTAADILELEHMIRSLPKSGRVPKSAREESEAKKKDMNKRSTAIQFNIKIDSQTQRRLQCSIPKFDAFLTKNADIVLLYDSPEPMVRGMPIPHVLASTRRKRVKKGGSLTTRKTTGSGGIRGKRSRS